MGTAAESQNIDKAASSRSGNRSRKVISATEKSSNQQSLTGTETYCMTCWSSRLCTSTNSVVTLVDEREHYNDQVLAGGGETWQNSPILSLHLNWILTNQTKISWLTTMLQVLACWIIFIDICIYYLTCFRKPSQCSQHQQRKTRRSWIWRISCRRFIRSWDLLGCRLQRRQTMNNAITWVIYRLHI